jgi:UDP-3-O-acyl-N-acetylglucosamine deacetylase
MPDIKVYKVKICRNKLPAKVTLPPDFISFCDDYDATANGQAFVLNKAGYRDVILDGTEYHGFKSDIEYHIYYNAAYPEVINGGSYFRTVRISDDPVLNSDNWRYENIPTNAEYELPDIIGNLIPHYIVGRLLSQDDKVRSIEELNTFETLLATVNVDRNVRQREYHSSRGWY